MSLQGYWAEMPSRAFKALPSDAVAVLPIGATEQHGPHLPVHVDTLLTDAVVAQSLPLLDPELTVLVLPTLAITKSGEHDRHPGTLSLSAQTLRAMLADIAKSVARSGIERLVLFNGHGGNTALLEIAARDMRMDHEMIVVTASWFAFADAAGLHDAPDLTHDLHAGYLETSAMLSVRPDLVDMSRATDFRTEMEGWTQRFSAVGLAGQPARPGWIIDDLNAQGACGDAASATAEAGAHLLGSAAQGFAAFLAEFARFDHRRTPQ
ncbi:MAG: creatininase family protein [Pseudomonadota bacterium]